MLVELNTESRKNRVQEKGEQVCVRACMNLVNGRMVFLNVGKELIGTIGYIFQKINKVGFLLIPNPYNCFG